MKKRINLFGLLLFLAFTGLNAQTPYFYYYNGEKQYFELNTSYAFVSFADENTASRGDVIDYQNKLFLQCNYEPKNIKL